MKKIVAIAMVISAISLGCKAHELINQDVKIDIQNRSGEEVTVRDQDNNKVTVADKEDQEGKFQLHQPEHKFLRAFHEHSTELEVRGEGKGTKKIQINGSDRRTLTIKPGLKCQLSGKGGDSSEKRSRDEDQDEDERPKKKRKTSQDEERKTGRDEDRDEDRGDDRD